MGSPMKRAGSRISCALRGSIAVLWLLATSLLTTGNEPSVSDYNSLIDEHVEDLWQLKEITAPTRLEDVSLLRRATLDLVGRVPTEQELRAFLRSTDQHRYEEAINYLMTLPEFERYQASILRRIWLPQLETQQYRHLIADFESWLVRELNAKRPFDELVRRQLEVPVAEQPIAVDPLQGSLGSPIFFAAADFDPAQLAANSARAFLGLNIDCAQCHDHPFARWSQESFWETAAFFARTNAVDSKKKSVAARIRIPDTEKFVTAVYLDGNKPVFDSATTHEFQQGSQTLARWITDRENPYFARNAVNRIWGSFFGRPLVFPEDDLSGTSDLPEDSVLRVISQQFVESGYDIRLLIKSIVLSDVYCQESQVIPVPGAEEETTLRQVRLMTATQLINSIAIASGASTDERIAAIESAFAEEFLLAKPTASPRSLVQGLLLMNDALIERSTSTDRGNLLRVLADVAYLTDEERIEVLFLRTLSRRPSEDELTALNGLTVDARMDDLLWALFNSAEFSTIK